LSRSLRRYKVKFCFSTSLDFLEFLVMYIGFFFDKPRREMLKMIYEQGWDDPEHIYAEMLRLHGHLLQILGKAQQRLEEEEYF